MSKTQENNEIMKKTGITPVTHYTSESMAKDLISLTPFEKGDIVLDSCSGRNKVWYNNLPDYVEKMECEIEDGCNFFDWNRKVDWTIGNPPFSLGWEFVKKSVAVSRKGIAYLGNHNFINSLFVPKRMEWLKYCGFTISNVHIVMDKRWYGRYYFIVFRKDWAGDAKIGWIEKTYNDGPKDDKLENQVDYAEFEII